MTSLDALSLTPSAREWFAQTTSARVLNSFDRACNLINQNNTILALVTSERGLTPFAMVVASEDRFPFRAVTESSAVTIEGNRLDVGSLRIAVGRARWWNPIPEWAAVRRLFADNAELPEALLATALDVAPEGSLLELCPHPGPACAPRSGRGWRKASGGGVRQALLARARQGATELVSGLQLGSLAQCVVGAKMLAGVGGGLTPAGDDFIVGVLLAARAGLCGEGREQLGPAIAEAAAPATTALSAAYLRAAARGECISPWHDLFAALMQLDEYAIYESVRALTSIGHTSGADALAGFLFIHTKELS